MTRKARAANLGTMNDSHKSGDVITARIFGQYLTMDRASWRCLGLDLKPGTDTFDRVGEISQRDSDKALAA